MTASLLAGGAAAAVASETAAGMTVARAALIRRADLGAGGSVGASAPRRVPTLTCSRFRPAIPPGMAERGAAASPSYEQSSSGPFVQAGAYAYASARQETEMWAAVVRPGLIRCVEQALRSGSGAGSSFTVSSAQLLTLPKLTARAAGHRVRGTASGSGQRIDVYLDMVVLGRGAAISTLSISSSESPPGRRLELGLARAGMRRVPAR